MHVPHSPRRLWRLDTRACGARPLGASILAPAALVHSTRRLRRRHTRACGARPLGAFGASILGTSALDLGPRLQILDPPLTDTGQLTLITETKLTLTLPLTLTDTVTLISQSKLSIYLSVYL